MSDSVKRNYGWSPDLPDHRDYKFAAIHTAKVLQDKVDLRKKCSLVEDQGQLGSCVGNALVGNLEYLENRTNKLFYDLSRLFAYFNARLLEGSTKTDSGAQIRDGIKALSIYGICKETDWPYLINKFANKPTAKCYKNAKPGAISNYYRLNSLDEMLGCLSDGFPFVFGFSVYDYFESAAMAKSGILKMPKATERLLGGHAVMAVGYDLKKKLVLVRNSWGADWGLKGYFWMPFEYLSNRNLSDDFWTIRQ
jgi:C1A family cysteine protease